MSTPHVLVLPFPAQGHVKPLVVFSHKLDQHGVKVTFVNTEFIHNQILSANMDIDNRDGPNRVGSNIDLVSIPDGLGLEEDRTELGKLCKAILDTMPAKLEELIRQYLNDKINITCVVADGNMGWAMEVAAKMGIKRAVVWPACAAIFLLELSVPRLMNDGILGTDGLPTGRKLIQLADGIQTMDTENIPWLAGDSTTQKLPFDAVVSISIQSYNLAQWWLCNSIYDIESAAFDLLPKLLPIGPLEAQNQTSNRSSLGSQFCAEDSSCLNWLDQQKPKSVIYLAFGSITVHDQSQFQELALGLELTGRPFLWVVRPGFVNNDQNGAFNPDGHEVSQFHANNNDKIKNLGKIVSWAPQEKVLGHPSVACFVSHCGWNSTIEGLSNGVPFLCWPYFADQFFNKNYICDIWKVGLGFEMNEKGIVSSEEVKKKVDQLIGDEDIIRRSLELKKIAMKNISEDGQSSNNFNNFIKWLET